MKNRKKYCGSHVSCEAVHSDSFSEIKQKIQAIMGTKHEDYETAYISEFNLIGRNVAIFYFSTKDNAWHRYPNKLTSYESWDNAMFPFKQITQWYLTTFGYKEASAKAINKLIQKHKINELYGK